MSRPHSPEWEERRIAAIRANSALRDHPVGWTHTAESKLKMSVATKAACQRDPDGVCERAIKNLPKNVSGEANGNWKGGKTKQARDFRNLNSAKMGKWRKAVLARDGKCKNCGSTERLEAHHIVPLGQTKSFAFLRANGVTLCRECHKKTDSYSAKGWRKLPMKSGKLIAEIVTIPHEWQDYETCGNWVASEDGSILILVSDLGNGPMNFLVGLHEMIEATLCEHRGIPEQTVSQFDIDHPDLDDPGHSPDSPYHWEHVFAEAMERLVAMELNVNWQEYGRTVDAL